MKFCAQCGMENTPETRFCRGCGAPFPASSLSTRPVADERFPAPKPSLASEKDEFARELGRSSQSLWVVLGVTGVVLVGGFGWLLGRNRKAPPDYESPPFPGATASPAPIETPTTPQEPSVTQGATNTSAVRFSDCTASASHSIRSEQGNRYSPDLAIDGQIATAWNAENQHHGIGEWIQFAWPQERSVSRIGVIVGYDKHSDKPKYSDDPWMWNRNNRLRQATLLFSNGGTIPLSFDDSTAMQYRSFSPVRCRWARLIVKDVYLDKYGGRDPKWDDIALSEVQVWGIVPSTGELE